MTSIRHSGQFKRGSNHSGAIDLVERATLLRQMPLGTLRIRLSAKIRRVNRSRQVIDTFCVACRTTRALSVDNLWSGKTTNCRCQRCRKYQQHPSDLVGLLGERFDAMKQRCKQGNGKVNKRYGNRGIQVRIKREEFINHFAERYTIAEVLNGVFDRINNDGHYELPNIRLTTARENNLNRENTRFTYFMGNEIACVKLFDEIKSRHWGFDYASAWTTRLAYAGMTGEEIIQRNEARRTR